jgi:hypothetical protein
MIRTILIACPGCNGEGFIEDLYSYDPRNDEPLGHRYRCCWCHGSGAVEEELLPIEQEDLDERDGELQVPLRSE